MSAAQTNGSRHSTTTHAPMIGLRLWLCEPPSPAARLLGPVSGLRELRVVTDASARGQGLASTGDRASLAGDCQAALDGIGPALKAHLGPRLKDFRRTILAELTALLGDAAGSRRAGQATLAMLAALREQGAAVAAWDDCVTCFVDGSEPLEVCGARVMQLREVVEARGHDWAARSQKLAELLQHDDPNFAREVAGLPPIDDVRAAWVAFDEAELSEGALRRGPLQFFDSNAWPQAALAEDPATGQPVAPELDEDVLRQLRAPTLNGRLVWCRVTLKGAAAVEPGEDAALLPPHERARELALAVVEAATFRLGGSRWKLQTGALLVREGGDTLMQDRFEDPDRRRSLRGFRDPRSDPTSGALDDLDAGFVAAVASGLPHAQEAIQEVRWYEAAEAAPDPAQRLALHVRALEHALPIVAGETWVDPARRYLREHWVHDRLNRIVFQLAHSAASELRYVDPAAVDELEQFVVWDEDDVGRFTVSYASTGRHAAAIADRLPRRLWHLRRAFRELHKVMTTHEAALAWLDDLGREFDTFLNRSVRQRNAIVHGVGTHPAVVESVVGFVAQLSAYVVAQTVHRVSSQRDPLGEFELGRAQALVVRDELARAERPVPQILWAPRDDSDL